MMKIQKTIMKYSQINHIKFTLNFNNAPHEGTFLADEILKKTNLGNAHQFLCARRQCLGLIHTYLFLAIPAVDGTVDGR